ncbi:hypothetical protein NPS01_08410 [Nocardioides psychrotolerans]|uniref:Uncharacterized protein n=1 Tax=Nocardioides psychrotolerans TaxID=1005945 RepID=A0A1I3FKB7_9ACTN|nr:hypothetical protein [Nocardioides psychrotolerans]GEP37178.1 hypothetical protein NPS01_08410 [Nocardioides psychrotolerans]SFI11572.1 hypothetical protein SAMN05216561_10521 [Nocardioides psychrotolerans]
MRDESDFEAYAVARWTALVRTAVLLGSRPDVALRQARSTLGLVRARWRGRDEVGDLDVHLYRTLLDVRRDDPVAWWSTAAPLDAAPLDPQWPALSASLDVLTPGDRASLVLRSVAALATEQVELVLGRELGPAPSDDTLRRVAESLHVTPVVLADVAAEQRADRRARGRRTTVTAGAVVAVLAVVVGGATWWGTRPEPRAPLTDVPVERSANRAPVAWYTDGTLHLTDVELRVEALRTFFEVDSGAVYADANGAIVHVDTDGVRTRIGTQRRDGTYQVSAEEGLVAWVDESDDRELRVWDLAAGEVVGTVPLSDDEDIDVVALDAGVAYYVERGRSQAYDVAADDVAEVASPRVLDVEGGAVARQESDGAISIASPRDLQDRIVTVVGLGAELSPDGAWVLTRSVEEDTGQVTRRLYDAQQNAEVDTGLDAGAVVFDASVLEGGAVTYLVELAQEDPDDGPRLSNSGSLQLTSCETPRPGLEPTCEVVLTFPRSTTWALAQ